MEYEILTDGETEKEIEIKQPASDLNGFIDMEISRIRKDLTMKGFRKGKVPANLIKSRYHDTLKAQAMKNLISDSFFKVLSEKKWRPASQPQLLNIEEGDCITFKLRFQVVPDFVVDNYKNLEVFQEDPLPDDYLLKQAINELRERYSTIKEVFRPAVVDDVATVDIEIVEGGATKSKQNGITIRIGDRSWPDDINKVLVGMKKLEKKEITIGKQDHKIHVKKIEEKILPAIDDNFAKLKKFKDFDHLKKKLLEEAKKFEEKRIEDEMKQSLTDVLLEKIKFKVPEALINNEYERMLRTSNLTDSPAIKEQFWKIAEKRARLNLIIDKIVEQENIKVNKAEAKKMIAALGIKPDDKNHENMVDYVSSMLLREKTIDFLYKNAKITKKSRIISPKEVVNDTSTIRH